MWLWLFSALFQYLHLIQLFLTGIGHTTGSNSGLVSLNKILFTGNFSLLTLVGRILLTTLNCIHLLELLIASGVAGKSSIFHMIDYICNRVQEWHIMGYQNKSIFIALQIGFQPFNMLHIQIVGRLVQNKNIRALEQQLCKKHLGALTTGKLIHHTVKANITKSQSTGHFLNLAVKGIEAMCIKDFLNLPCIIQQLLHFLRGGLSHFVIAGLHLRFQLVHLIKGCF